MLVDYEVDSYAVILSSIFDISQEEGEKLINDGDAATEFKGKKYHIITKKSDDDIFTFITTFEDEEKLLDYLNSDEVKTICITFRHNRLLIQSICNSDKFMV